MIFVKFLIKHNHVFTKSDVKINGKITVALTLTSIGVPHDFTF